MLNRNIDAGYIVCPVKIAPAEQAIYKVLLFLTLLIINLSIFDFHRLMYRLRRPLLRTRYGKLLRTE